jgi:hypothetical protein
MLLQLHHHQGDRVEMDHRPSNAAANQYHDKTGVQRLLHAQAFAEQDPEKEKKKNNHSVSHSLSMSKPVKLNKFVPLLLGNMPHKSYSICSKVYNHH